MGRKKLPPAEVRRIELGLTEERVAQRRGLLRAIHEADQEHPSSDVPRLIFADWLEEYGINPDWPALIRVLIQMDNLPEGRQECADANSWEDTCDGSDWREQTTRRCDYCRLDVVYRRILDDWDERPPIDPPMPPGRHWHGYDAGPLCLWDRGFIHSYVGGATIDGTPHFYMTDWDRQGPLAMAVHRNMRLALMGHVPYWQQVAYRQLGSAHRAPYLRVGALAKVMRARAMTIAEEKQLF